MQEFCVRGVGPLKGTLRVQGAKNSVLPLLAASLLCGDKTVTLTDVPYLSDVDVSVNLLTTLGCRVERQGHTLQVDATAAAPTVLGEELCCRMRSSVLYLGPLLGRFGKAQLSYPGGCVLGERPSIYISAHWNKWVHSLSVPMIHSLLTALGDCKEQRSICAIQVSVLPKTF